MAMNTRGFELQFHWIFVLIAGTIILAFFFSVVQKQRSMSEERMSITLSTDIDAVFSGALESRGTSQSLTVPESGISFSCSDACDCNFWVGRKATQFRDKIIFAPAFLDAGRAVAWSLDWKVPFRAANFLFLMSSADKYFLVMDSVDSKSRGLFSRLNRSLPGDVALRIISPEEIPLVIPSSGLRYRFVFLDVPSAPPFGLSDGFGKIDVSVVYVNSVGKTVTFYSKSKRGFDFSSDSSLFLGDSGIFAAIFAEDKAMFECGMKKAFSRLSVVSDILRSRAGTLEVDMLSSGRADCVYSAPGMDYLGDISGGAGVLADSSSFVDDMDEFNAIAGAVDSIDGLNANLVHQSCPWIY
jgi:hypothetical protein